MTSCDCSVASSESFGPSVNCAATPGTTRTSRIPAVSPMRNGTSLSCSSTGTVARVVSVASAARTDASV